MKWAKISEFVWLSLIRIGVLLAIILPGVHYLGPYLEGVTRGLIWSTLWGGILLSAVIIALAYFEVNRQSLLWAGIFLDLLLITLLVYFTGGSSSDMVMLYLIPVGVAAYYFGLRGSVLTGILFAVLFGFFVVGESNNLIRPFITYETVFPASITLRYYLFIILFLGIAGVAGYLSVRYKQRERAFTQAKFTLEKYQMNLGAVLENMVSAIVVLDNYGEVMLMNKTAYRILGIPANNSNNKITRLEIKENYPEVDKLLEKVVHDLPVSRGIMKLKTKNGRTVDIGYSTSYLKDEKGEKTGIVMVFQDLSRKKEMDKDLRRWDRVTVINEFAKGLAQEIRTPVTAIQGAAELLDTEVNGEERARLTRLIKRETHRLNQIVTDFLKFAHIEPPKLEHVEMVQHIRETLESIEIPDHIRTVIDSLKDEFWVYTDRKLMYTVIKNLVTNAVDAIMEKPDTGTVQISLRKSGEFYSILNNGKDIVEEGQFLLSIRDNGTGMDEETLERVFDPFYTTKREGSGMGLPIVKKIVQSLDGKMEVYSFKGIGTQILMFFPEWK